MTDIVTRLRNWREVHLARLHLLMDEAADEIERLSAKCDCPGQDNAAKRDNNERLAALQALAELDEDLGLPRRTPATHATPSEGSVQSECTLTDSEREAIESAIWDYEQNDDDADCARMVATLERLLERME
jgi:hypothetical protein